VAYVARYIYSDIFTAVAKVTVVWPSDFEKDKLQIFTSGHPDFGKIAARKLKTLIVNCKYHSFHCLYFIYRGTQWLRLWALMSNDRTISE
jgi:hypothetical protein